MVLTIKDVDGRHFTNVTAEILSDEDGVHLVVFDLDTNKIVATLSMSKEQSAKIGEILTHAPNW